LHRVGIERKLVDFHGLDWEAMLEGIGCPKGGIGAGIVE